MTGKRFNWQRKSPNHLIRVTAFFIYSLLLITKTNIMTVTKITRSPKQKGTRTRKPYTKRACVNCKIAHTACSSERPCKIMNFFD